MRGILLDDRYRPAPNVPVTSIVSTDCDVAAAIARPLAHSDEDGAFVVTLSVSKKYSTYLLVGGKRFAVQRAYIASSRDKHDLGVMALARGFTAIGKVRAADGKALPGAVVVGTCGFRRRPYARSDYDRSVVYRTSGAVSDRGVFRLPGMLRSMAEVRVSCDGYFDAVATAVAIGMPLDFVLHPSAPVSGRALDDAGEPAAGVDIAIGSARGKTNEDGRFTVSPRERHVANVRAWTFRDGSYMHASMKLERADAEVELKLKVSSGSDGTLRVQATNAAGKPLQEFEAFASWNPEDQLEYRPDAQMLAHACVRKGMSAKTTTGVAEVGVEAHDRSDVVFVFVRAAQCGWGRVRLSRTDVGDDAIVVQLPKPSVLSGRVTDKVTKKPVAGAQIVFTQRLTDGQRSSYESGHSGLTQLVKGPACVTTDERGEWRIDNAPPGAAHLFVCLDGFSVAPAKPVAVVEGKNVGDLDFAVPTHTTIRGKVEKPWPSWLRIRPHWHRPNMWSSGWPSEFDGSIELAEDGTFAMPGLPPLLYKMELVFPVPVRAGHRLKVDGETWDGRDPPAEPMTMDAGFSLAQGTVRGEVPWSRLAVVALTSKDNFVRTSFDVKGSVALLGPDRSFCMPVSRLKMRWILFDVVTGIAIGSRDIEPAELDHPIEWGGEATEVTIGVHRREGTARPAYRFTYLPTDEHWAMPRSPFGNQFQKKGVPFDVTVGEDLKLWLPDKSGTLDVASGEGKVSVDVAEVRGDTVTFEVDENVIRRR